MSRYTPEVRRIFEAMAPKNPKFIVDIVEYPQYPGLLFLQTYEPNIRSLSEKELVQFSQEVWMLKNAIHAVTPCDIVKIDAQPPHSQVIKQAREERSRADGM